MICDSLFYLAVHTITQRVPYYAVALDWRKIERTIDIICSSHLKSLLRLNW